MASAAAEILAVYSWQPYSHPKETAKLTSAWTDFRDCDVILIGSSLAELGLASPVIQTEAEKELGREVCVLNVGQKGLSSESAVSLLRAILAWSDPQIVIWGTSPQECMSRGRRRYLTAYASPWDVIRATWSGPDSLSEARRLLPAYFRPPALLLEAGVWSAGEVLGPLLHLAPTGFQVERARVRRHGGWHPMESRLGGSKADWVGPVQWRSVTELAELGRQHDIQLAFLLMPVDEDVAKVEANIRRDFAAQFGEFCRREGIPYFDLSRVPYRLQPTDYMKDGRHIVIGGARKLSREISRRIVIPMLKRSARAG